MEGGRGENNEGGGGVNNEIYKFVSKPANVIYLIVGMAFMVVFCVYCCICRPKMKRQKNFRKLEGLSEE